MEIKVRYDCDGVDWNTVAETLKDAGMVYHDPDAHRRAFEASHTAVFIYHADQLIGFGRAISDGIRQAAVYDCAVLPEFQGRGLGAALMKNIINQIPGCSVILYATPGKEGFYKKIGFRKMKTAMAYFQNSDSKRALGYTE